MKTLVQNIRNHYLREGLFEIIQNGLIEKGIDLHSVTRQDIAAVDEFHVRGAAVSRELAQMVDLQGKSLLDVGCGLGGACRMLADEYLDQVTGIDLSEEYIRTANELSKMVKLDHKTKFIVGNATQLPFKGKEFEAVWTQHVQMNIPNKDQFYAEIARVLKPGGHFLYYEIFKGNDKAISYPVPWAANPELSFLFRNHDMHRYLEALGLQKIASTDQTLAGIDFFEKMIMKIKTNGPPKLGLNLLMGETTFSKISNLLEDLKRGAVVLESGVYQKMA